MSWKNGAQITKLDPRMLGEICARIVGYRVQKLMLTSLSSLPGMGKLMTLGTCYQRRKHKHMDDFQI